VNRKVKSFEQKAFLSEHYAVLKVKTSVQSEQSFCQSFIALMIIRCSKSNP